MLASFLESKEEFQEEVREFFKHNPPTSNHLGAARKLKNLLRKKAKKNDATEEDKARANQALRQYNYLLNLERSKAEARKAKQEEKAYKKNFYKTAKDITNGTFGMDKVTPAFDKEKANDFYKNRYSEPVIIDPAKLVWFPKVEPPQTSYNMLPYRPKDIKEALLKKNKTSAPGNDDILYGFLLHMNSTHRVLSTLFTKIRDSGIAPDIWGSSKIILLHKGGSSEDPSMFRMISLTLNIGKLYHTLEAKRHMDFMISNGYIDPASQKAFIEGVNGCVEHIEVVQEVIQHARLNKKTVHITWFDLADAFGSVSHDLIPIVLAHYNTPQIIIDYIMDLYSKLEGKVVTPDWETELFEFNKGVFQGDPYSCVIFLVVFNPIIQYIKEHSDKTGYEIKTNNNNNNNNNSMFVNTTPFADDFNLISRNKTQHQKLISDIQKKIKSMGLVIKPTKCSSLSIQSGKSSDIVFHLTEENEKVEIGLVKKEPQKFLGSIVTALNKPSEMFQFLFDKLEKKLENIDKCSLRGEHKLKIYSNYALISMRYHFSVHDIHKTHLEKLDLVAKKYLKKWLKIPSHGASDIAIFHPYLLSVKTPSQLYMEGHAGNYTLMRIKGDQTVNHALDSRLERESSWTQKSSTIVQCHQILEKNIENDCIFIPSPLNCPNVDHARRHAIPRAKMAIKKSIEEETLDVWNKKVQQ